MRPLPGITRLLVLGLTTLPVAGQAFQSSFSEVQYDRARTPVTLNGPVEVDGPSGAVSIDFKLGPGIGRGALHFTPALRGRFAATLWGEQITGTPPDAWPNLWCDRAMAYQAVVAWYNSWYSQYTVMSGGGASFSPGTFDLLLNDSHRHNLTTNFTLPDGTSSSMIGDPPAEMVADRGRAVLTAFNYPSSTQVCGLNARGDAYDFKVPFIKVGARDELILGLEDPAFPLMSEVDQNNADWVAGDPSFYQYFPRRILVVTGEVAVEYVYDYPTYANVSVPFPRTINHSYGKEYAPLRTGRYQVRRILDRFGEAIEFNHNPAGQNNGVDFDATWTRNGEPIVAGERLEVRLQPVPTGAPVSFPILQDPRLSAYPTEQGTVTFTYVGDGFGGQSRYILEGTTNIGGTINGGIQPDLFRTNVQPLRLRREGSGVDGDTGEDVTFGYQTRGAREGEGLQVVEAQTQTAVPVAVTQLYQVTMPGRTVTLTWKAYPWRKNLCGSDVFTGFLPAPPYAYPQYFFGVSAIQDNNRVTTHTRVVPTPDFSSASSGGWADTAFYDAITHPDQSVTLTLYTGPIPGTTSVTPGTSSDQDLVQTLAFLKHQVREIRHYAPGTDWQSDLGVEAASSSAFSIERLDRFTFCRVGNPTGALTVASIPDLARKQSLNKDTGVLRLEEKRDWDGGNRGWKTFVNRAYTAPLFTFEWGYPDLAPAAPPASSFDQSTTKTYQSDWLNWWPARSATESKTGQPTRTLVWEASGNLLSSTLDAGGGSVTTAFTYLSGTNRLGSVTLSGAAPVGVGLGQSGDVGIDQYEYDARGFLTSIKPKGVAWTLRQTQDAFGRPLSQTQADGVTHGYQWDAAGRLKAILPASSLEAPTSITYDADNLGATVTRGALGPQSKVRYNGFGELILVQRAMGTGTWSHQRLDYDVLGRKVTETVWLPGSGSETESTASVAATRYGFDAHGRPSSLLDPNGVATGTTYAGLSRMVTVAGGTAAEKTTEFVSDPLGRTVLIKNLSQGDDQTRMTFDDGGRILEVVQSGGGRSQSRQWAYGPLYWLTALTQPESGTTLYSQFTVQGKPGATTYGVQGLEVTRVYDALGRVVSVSSAGVAGGPSSVQQSFAYDRDPVTSAIVPGKLLRAQDGAISQAYTYNAATGWLETLATTIEGTTYTQAFATNPYGNRIGTTFQGLEGEAPRTLATAFNDALGLPMEVLHRIGEGASKRLGFVNSVDPVTGNPLSLVYGSQGASSFFTCRPDQVGLTSISHYVGGNASPYRQWTYTYDLAGRLTGDGENTYGYDALDRLVSATVPVPHGVTLTQTFAYDAFGNMTKSQTDSSSAAAMPWINNFLFTGAELDHLANTNQLPGGAIGVPTGATYDAYGNLIQIYAKAGSSGYPSLNLAYDALGRVVRMVYQETAASVPQVEEYAYGADGLRAWIRTLTGGVLSTIKHKVYNDKRQLVSEYEAQYAP
ncbi:hypothetical protein [Mesoterricola sediminis]|uniref:YD repeat-containing protein n=1 Tax=Mesoterricola sediminis TaxID=2927980 RepID=A0AA48H0Y0_9BACT|nr:hypothetical protein [Mesoterricola sediminis]BDU75466.1 hypothetical protein METESE_04240 [Mesoterricola sediminis]